MKKSTDTQWIATLHENQNIDGKHCLVKEANKAITKTGKPYINLKLSDSSGNIDGKIWDNVEVLEKECQPGHIVTLRGNTQKYRKSLQIVIEKVKQVDSGEINILQFLPKTSKDIEGMYNELIKIVEGLDDKNIRELLTKILTDKIISAKFKNAPAAKNMHHAYIGGLLEHTLNICNVASMVADYYAPTVDRSILLAGAILHDIGKIEEFNLLGSDSYCLESNPFDYSDAGRLIGHMVLAVSMIDHHLSKIKNFPQDTAIKIKHMILSHHGRHEFGSPTLPMFLEAFILNFIDDMDAKINYIEKLARNTPSDEKMKWSDYQRMLERFILLPEENKEQKYNDDGLSLEETKKESNNKDQLSLF